MSAARKRTFHGKTKSRVYRIWGDMLSRCRNPNVASWEFYGGRGIKVCERWQDFKNFYADMGDPPDGYSLERKDIDRDYASDNCIWVPLSSQALNRRSNRRLTFGGKTQTMKEWALELGIGPRTLRSRLRNGWPIEKALSAPVAKALGQYDRAKLKRKAPSGSEKIAALLVEISRLQQAVGKAPLIPDSIREQGTKAIIKSVQWDHIIPVALNGSSHPTNLQPLSKAEHASKTKHDVKRIAAAKRKAQPPPKPRLKRKLNGKTVERDLPDDMVEAIGELRTLGVADGMIASYAKISVDRVKSISPCKPAVERSRGMQILSARGRVENAAWRREIGI